MTHHVIAIPGSTTYYDAGPIVRIAGREDEPVSLTIQYHASELHAPGGPKYGEISFKEIFEYRFVIEPADFLESSGDVKFGLIEITDSSLIRELVSKEARENLPGPPFGDIIKNSSLKHFRIVFSKYGRFDIIAVDVEVREIAALTDT